MKLWPFPGSETKEHPKVLILVLSALREPWGEMLNVQRSTWDAVKHPQTQTLYYCGRFNGVPPAWDDAFFSEHHGEELEEITPRTREAFKHALTLEWDFIARVHSSGYVHKKNLVDFIEDEFVFENPWAQARAARPNVFCGLLTTGEKPFLWGGGSYILSRDVVQRFVENWDRWNLGIMEDNAMTELAQELGIPFSNGRMCSINMMQNGDVGVMSYGIGENFSFGQHDWKEQINRCQPHWIFRCKQDQMRHQDLEIFRNLNRYYL